MLIYKAFDLQSILIAFFGVILITVLSIIFCVDYKKIPSLHALNKIFRTATKHFSLPPTLQKEGITVGIFYDLSFLVSILFPISHESILLIWLLFQE